MPKPTQILRSVGKTINLAKPQVYQVPRKPPLNSLVFEKLPEPRCGDRIALNTPPTPKPVRVCTKEELQALYCCPPPCDCKLKCKLSFSEKLGYMCKFAAKLFLIKEMIRISWKQGLWSDGFHTTCIIGQVLEFCPKTRADEENEYASSDVIIIPTEQPCMPYIPRMDSFLYMLSHMWNKFVKYAFWTVMDGPFELIGFFASLFEKKEKIEPEDECAEIRKRNKI